MRIAFCVDQDVAGFDVSMEDAVFMGVVNCAGQLGDQLRCVTDRHRFALRNGIELATVHESHAEVTGAVALPDFVNRDDARMVQAGSGFRFAAEALQMRFRGPMSQTDNFECYCAV